MTLTPCHFSYNCFYLVIRRANLLRILFFSAINRMSIQTKTGKCGSQDEPPDQSTDQDSNPSLEGDSPEEESGQFIFGQTYRSSADLIFE